MQYEKIDICYDVFKAKKLAKSSKSYAMLPLYAGLIKTGSPLSKIVLIGMTHRVDAVGMMPWTDELVDEIADFAQCSHNEVHGELESLCHYGILKVHILVDGLWVSLPAYEDMSGEIPTPTIPMAEMTQTCSPSLRRRVYRAFTVCEYCGADPEYPTVDRIIPGAKGGRYSAENVTLCCQPCNSRKGPREFIGPVRSLAVMEFMK